VTELGEM